MRFHVDRRFLAAHARTPLSLRITYLDEGDGRFDVSAWGRRETASFSGSGRWKTAQWAIPPGDRVVAGEADITIRAIGGPLTLHMVETAAEAQ